MIIDGMKIAEKESCFRQLMIKGEMQAKLVSPRKMILLWETYDLPKPFLDLFLNISSEELVQAIRIYDVTNVKFNGENAHHFFEITVPYQQEYWFVKGLLSNRRYLAEIGVITAGSFIPLLRSNPVQTPKLDSAVQHPIYQDVFQLQQYEERIPAQTEHISTYCYFVERDHDRSVK